jgi:hypothetical protein
MALPTTMTRLHICSNVCAKNREGEWLTVEFQAMYQTETDQQYGLAKVRILYKQVNDATCYECLPHTEIG